MRKFRPFVFIGLIACGSNNATPDAKIVVPDAAPDAKIFMDAPPPMFDFTCMGNSAPTTVAANVTMSGIVTELSVNGITPQITTLDGATVDACMAGAANCTGGNHYGTQATSAGGGVFSIGPVATTGAPLDAYLAMAKTGDRPARVFPASAFVADQPNIPVLTFTNTAFALLTAQFTQSAANGTLGLAITDCAGDPITDSANVTISVKQGGNPVSGTMTFDVSAISAMAAGSFIVFNVPPGATEVGATYKTMTLRAHSVGVVAATTSETIIRPGY